MKASELRTQSRQALTQELAKLQSALQAVRFEQLASKSKNVRKLRTVRRDIARVLTVLRLAKPA
ncbi:50S ribosomal protein L29 [Candidatus Parcubacteria bacterium]|nr:50S ribosomal protein L29 [Candidatus Parcubacteria bacterium]